MGELSISLNPQFYQRLFESYAESTTYTTDVNFWGEVTTTPSTSYHQTGYELHTYYGIWGYLKYNAEKEVKYINFSVLLYNRVKDVIGNVKYSFMGPYIGNISLELDRSFGEGLPKGAIEYMGINAITIDYMDGSNEEVELNCIYPVEVLDVETPEDREKESRPTEPPEYGKIFAINFFLTPLAGLIYSLYKLLRGFKRAAKAYFIVTGGWIAFYFIAGIVSYIVNHH